MRAKVTALGRKAAGFLFRPGESFRRLKDETPRAAAAYYLTLFTLNLAVTVIIAILTGGIKPELFSDPGISISLKVITAVLVIGPSRTLVAGTLGLVLFGLMVHVPVVIAGRQNAISTTFRVVAYSLTPALLTGWLFELFMDSFIWISYLKGDAAVIVSIIAFVLCVAWIIAIPLWTLELLYHGIIEVHGLSAGQARWITSVATAILFFAGVILIFLFILGSWAAATVPPHYTRDQAIARTPTQMMCGPGLTRCLSGCKNLSTDKSDCGMCGNACPLNQTCRNAVCA
jgi:hypothetical protein